ncbi:hypothetical protein [uncultured Cytophaga sp.]|uniref:WapI family immunity protein n=1 Tax=uncultured Cytophaga sp. TaxID=160238 RepID=UPI0026257ACB|nr:hypothetical protein [uncultured Cytophaga sp.]
MNPYLEMLDAASGIRLEPIEFIYTEQEIDWDNNWLRTLVTVKANDFSETYEANFLTLDFERFKQELLLLNTDSCACAVFCGLEDQLEIAITRATPDSFFVRIRSSDQVTNDAMPVSYELTLQQATLDVLISQLQMITKAFPIRGDFTIKNS